MRTEGVEWSAGKRGEHGAYQGDWRACRIAGMESESTSSLHLKLNM